MTKRKQSFSAVVARDEIAKRRIDCTGCRTPRAALNHALAIWDYERFGEPRYIDIYRGSKMIAAYDLDPDYGTYVRVG